MTYEVIQQFADTQDKTKSFPDGRIYSIGDSFPSTKRKIDPERLKELMSNKNRIGKAVIRQINKGDE